MDPLLLGFLGVALAAAVTPGPDTAVILRNALDGHARGLLAVAGVLCGLVAHATLAVVGLSAVLLASATLFEVVKWAGAAYLLHVGATMLIGATRGTPAAPDAPAARGTAFRQGLLTNLLNPKTSLFFVTLLPQFVPAGTSPAARTLLLSALLLAVAGAWYVVLTALAARLGPVLRGGAARRALDALTGVVLVGLAVRLAATRR